MAITHITIAETLGPAGNASGSREIKLSTKDCGACPSRTRCIHSIKKYQRRTLTVRPKEAYEALQAARQRENTAEFVATYAKRAGIEGTL